MARKAKRDLTIEQKLARGPIDLPFLALVMLLTAIGLIMVLSASYASAMYNSSAGINTEGDPLYFFKRQFVFALIGVAGMYIISKIDYQHFRWMSVFVLAASIVLMLLVFVPGIGKTGGGAQRWVSIFGIRFQPSEIAKVGVIMFFAAGLSKRTGQVGLDRRWSKRTFTGRMAARLDHVGLLELVPYGVALAVVLGIIAAQHHMSAMILVVVAAASVLFAAGVPLGWFAAGGALVGGALLILGDRARRVAEFIEQANGVTQLLMELMGALLPLFIFLVVSRMFWTGSLAALSFSLVGDGLRDALDPKLKN